MLKNLSETEQKEREGDLILGKLASTDELFVLDDKGESYSSVGFSKFMQKKMNSGLKQMVLVIGGPYGFSEAVYKKSEG